MFTLRQYLFSVEDPYGLFRTLENIEFERDATGQIRYRIGNSAVSFPVRYNGERYALRCYFNPHRNLRRIYQAGYYERELFIYDAPPRGRWVDVVLIPWVEGEELTMVLLRALKELDKGSLATLSAQFDSLATALLQAPWAHGDLKPENIIVDNQGALQLIDRDGMFLPEMAGEQSPELGTAAYQHPLRTAELFDATLDDYSVALLSTALHALSLDPTLHARYGHREGLIIDSRHPAEDEALNEILHLFARNGLAVRYRIARTLLRRRPNTLLCRPLFELLGKPFASIEEPWPELFFSEEGLWGFRREDEVVIPPLYDEGYDFSEGVAAVRLGDYWHFIDPTGRVALHCPPCRGVKPFRNGYAILYTDEGDFRIDLAGNRFEF